MTLCQENFIYKEPGLLPSARELSFADPASQSWLSYFVLLKNHLLKIEFPELVCAQ